MRVARCHTARRRLRHRRARRHTSWRSSRLDPPGARFSSWSAASDGRDAVGEQRQLAGERARRRGLARLGERAAARRRARCRRVGAPRRIGSRSVPELRGFGILLALAQLPDAAAAARAPRGGGGGAARLAGDHPSVNVNGRVHDHARARRDDKRSEYVHTIGDPMTHRSYDGGAAAFLDALASFPRVSRAVGARRIRRERRASGCGGHLARGGRRGAPEPGTHSSRSCATTTRPARRRRRSGRERVRGDPAAGGETRALSASAAELAMARLEQARFAAADDADRSALEADAADRTHTPADARERGGRARAREGIRQGVRRGVTARERPRGSLFGNKRVWSVVVISSSAEKAGIISGRSRSSSANLFAPRFRATKRRGTRVGVFVKAIFRLPCGVPVWTFH